MSPKQKMTRDEEHEFYARAENQEPQGPPRRRRSRLTRYRRPAPTFGTGKGGQTCLLTLALWGALSAAFVSAAARLARK